MTYTHPTRHRRPHTRMPKKERRKRMAEAMAHFADLWERKNASPTQTTERKEQTDGR